MQKCQQWAETRRRAEAAGQPQALWGVGGGGGGEAAERGDAPAAPPKASPFPRLTGAGPWSGHEVHFRSSSFCFASGGGAGLLETQGPFLPELQKLNIKKPLQIE